MSDGVKRAAIIQMQSNTLSIHPHQHPEHILSHSRSIRERSQRHSSSRSDHESSIHTKIRKASMHQFAQEAEQFQAGHDERHSLRARHSLPLPSDPEAINLHDPFLQSRIHDQLETHLQRLQRQEGGRQGEGEEQLEELEYTTFRLVKREEKTHLSELRQKLMPLRGQQHV